MTLNTIETKLNLRIKKLIRFACNHLIITTIIDHLSCVNSLIFCFSTNFFFIFNNISFLHVIFEFSTTFKNELIKKYEINQKQWSIVVDRLQFFKNVYDDQFFFWFRITNINRWIIELNTNKQKLLNWSFDRFSILIFRFDSTRRYHFFNSIRIKTRIEFNSIRQDFESN